MKYYVSLGVDILGKYNYNPSLKYPASDKSKEYFFYNKFCWTLGNLVGILIYEISNEIQYDSHRGYQKHFYYVNNGKMHINMFKEHINNNLNSIYDFTRSWSVCSEYVFETKEIRK